ncbi:MAG: hypothetical protein AB1420_09760 [Bacillota bacterium]
MEEAGVKKLRGIEDSVVEIIADTQNFDVGARTQGVSITGFIDVEKIIRLGFQRFFIEKKLPFHVLIIRRPVFFVEDGFGEK